MKGLIKHTDIHLRIRTQIAEAGRESRAATETIEDEKSLAILLHSPFQEKSLGHPLYVGLARSYECSRRTIHLSGGIGQ